MVRSGVLEAVRVELIDGVMVEVAPEYAPHASTITKLSQWLVRAAPDEVLVRIQHPLRLGDVTEPEPDVALVPYGDYDEIHPTTALLVIEVSQSSLGYDRPFKGQLYARAEIPEYWVVNLKDRVVEVYTEPKGGQYTAMRIVRPGESLRPTAVPLLATLESPVDSILPRPRKG